MRSFYGGDGLAVRPDYRSFVLEQLEFAGPIVAKSMFGGLGLYSGKYFFAIVFNDALYFKVDDANRTDYITNGMSPFQPFKHKPATLQYYEVPIHIIEDRKLLKIWAAKAIDAAKYSKRRKPK
ncbi:MAG: TfoX/Sxy family protein [bacterium]